MAVFRFVLLMLIVSPMCSLVALRMFAVYLEIFRLLMDYIFRNPRVLAMPNFKFGGNVVVNAFAYYFLQISST